MDNSYKRMFVLNEDEYQEFKRYKSGLNLPTTETSPSEGIKCPICGREYPNENILAHHLKSHVDGFKCNICGKVFKFKKNLNVHLRKHAPQVQQSEHSVLDKNMPNQPSEPTAVPMKQAAVPTAVLIQQAAVPTAVPKKQSAVPTAVLIQQAAVPKKQSAVPTAVSKKPSAVPKKHHKRKSILNFKVKQWLKL